MESLALVVSLILLGILVLGAVSVVVVLRPPRRRFWQVLVTLPAGGAALSGIWLATREVAFAGRLIGVGVALAGAAAAFRLWRPASQGR
jgi:hypothetical protein